MIYIIETGSYSDRTTIAVLQHRSDKKDIQQLAYEFQVDVAWPSYSVPYDMRKEYAIKLAEEYDVKDTKHYAKERIFIAWLVKKHGFKEVVHTTENIDI